MKLNSTALEALRDIALAAGDDWGRPLLAQLRIAAVEGGLALDATDSYIWVHRHILADVEEAVVGTTVLVPARTVRGIALACLRDGGAVTCDMTDRGLTIRWENGGLTASEVSVEAYETRAAKYPTDSWRNRPADPVDSVIVSPALLSRATRALGSDPDQYPGVGVQLELAELPQPLKLTLAGATTDYAWVMPQRPPGNH